MKQITKNGLVVDELTDLASQLATPSAAAAQAVTPVSAIEPSVFASNLVCYILRELDGTLRSYERKNFTVTE